MSLSAGSRLGPFDILSPLGAGGFGEVNPLSGRTRCLRRREDDHQIFVQLCLDRERLGGVLKFYYRAIQNPASNVNSQNFKRMPN